VPPGGPGLRPHRHSGPVFGYVLEGEIIFEVEGEPERIIRAGEAFWEPGGDVIHYQDGNNLADAWSRFVVVMMMVPGQQMVTLVAPDDLARRRARRAPRSRCPTGHPGSRRRPAQRVRQVSPVFRLSSPRLPPRSKR